MENTEVIDIDELLGDEPKQVSEWYNDVILFRFSGKTNETKYTSGPIYDPFWPFIKSTLE